LFHESGNLELDRTTALIMSVVVLAAEVPASNRGLAYFNPPRDLSPSLRYSGGWSCEFKIINIDCEQELEFLMPKA
jgi:hypothetical protein